MIRELTENDLDIVKNLEEKTEFVIDGMLDCEGYCWGCFENNKLIGFCTIGEVAGWDEVEENDPNALVLSEVSIGYDYQGQGYGLKLVEGAIKAYSKHFQDNHNVYVDLLEPELSGFYKKLGFEYLNEDDEYIMVLRRGH